MINRDADHSVKFHAQLVRVRLCRQSFAFFGSSPARVVEHLRSILWGQNLNNCNDEPTQVPFTLCDDPEAPAKIFVFQCSSKVLLTDADVEAFTQALIKDQETFANRAQWMRTQAAALQATNR